MSGRLADPSLPLKSQVGTDCQVVRNTLNSKARAECERSST